MSIQIRRGGIGTEGKAQFVVKTYAIVEVTSVPVQADTIQEAVQKAHDSIDFEKALRNITPNETVMGVQFVDQFDGAEVWLSLFGLPVHRLVEFNDEELDEILRG